MHFARFAPRPGRAPYSPDPRWVAKKLTLKSPPSHRAPFCKSPILKQVAWEGKTREPIRFDSGEKWLQIGATMKIATVRDLRNRYTSVLRWVSAGEEVLITQRGKVIARLSPETDQTAQEVDWASSPEVLRDRSGDPVLSAEQSAEILAEAGGKW